MNIDSIEYTATRLTSVLSLNQHSTIGSPTHISLLHMLLPWMLRNSEINSKRFTHNSRSVICFHSYLLGARHSECDKPAFCDKPICKTYNNNNALTHCPILLHTRGHNHTNYDLSLTPSIDSILIYTRHTRLYLAKWLPKLSLSCVESEGVCMCVYRHQLCRKRIHYIVPNNQRIITHLLESNTFAHECAAINVRLFGDGIFYSIETYTWETSIERQWLHSNHL